MKIQELHVERFGALRGYNVRDLPDGLTIFYGPNGAGKSTLFAFLRQMLFDVGRPDAERQSDSLYGTCTGRLICAGQDGIYTVARKGDHPAVLVTRPDGSDGGAVNLDSLFGGADSRQMGALLAFDVCDLHGLPVTSPAVRERIFPTSLSRGLKSIQRAIDTIQQRKSELMRADIDARKQGDVPTELQARIEQSSRAAGRLYQLLQAQAQARATLDLRVRSLSNLAAEKARHAALVDLSPVWYEMTQARRTLKTLEAVDEFPTDAETRLEQALLARDAAERSVKQLIYQGRLSVERESVLGPPPFVDNNDPVTAVVRRRVHLPDLPTTGTEGLVAWQRRLKETAEATQDRRRELEETTRSKCELEQRRAAMSALLARPEPPTTTTLDEEARLVQSVRAHLAAFDGEQASAKHWQEVIAERSTAIHALEGEVVAAPSTLLPYIGWLAAAVGVAAAAWHQMEGDGVAATLIASCSLAAVVVSIIHRVRRTKILVDESSRSSRLREVRREVEQACQNLIHHQERASRRRFDISVDCVRLGLPPLPSAHHLQKRAAELDEQKKQRSDREGAHAGLADTTPLLVEIEASHRQRAQALMVAQEHEHETIREWHQWKLRAGIIDGASTTTSEGARAEAELLEHCRRLQIQIAECEQTAAQSNYRVRAAIVGIGSSETHPPMGSLSTHRNGPCQGEGGFRESATPAPTHELSPALQAARRRLGQCEDALRQLFLEGGASDEAGFRARLAAFHSRSTLTRSIRACEARSDERLKGEPGAEIILRELAENRMDEWQHRASQAAAELLSHQSSRDEAQQQLRRLEPDIFDASAELADLSVLEQERSAFAAEAAATNRMWRTLVIAASLIEDARRHVELEAQPPILRRAAEVLAAVSGSRYDRLAPSDGERELRVRDCRSGWTSVDQLSRGTMEQVYFSLRLGLAAESAHGGVPSAVVLDDVLDHMDSKRSRLMARRIVEIGRRHQVLVFTRRPEICELLRGLDPALNIITMPEL